MLSDLGADQPGFVPAICYPPDQGERHDGPAAPGGPDSSPAAGSAPALVQDQGLTAGEVFGWGAPDVVDDFTGTQLGPGWNAYDGPGHAGNGVRSRTQPRSPTVS